MTGLIDRLISLYVFSSFLALLHCLVIHPSIHSSIDALLFSTVWNVTWTTRTRWQEEGDSIESLCTYILQCVSLLLSERFHFICLLIIFFVWSFSLVVLTSFIKIPKKSLSLWRRILLKKVSQKRLSNSLILPRYTSVII